MDLPGLEHYIHPCITEIIWLTFDVIIDDEGIPLLFRGKTYKL